MDEVPPKKSTLSVDRAAFLLLRVKKAFKKKRHVRKEKPIQSSDVLQAQARSSRKMPPPLLRSRTLPAIVLPGIPVMSLHTESTYIYLDDPVGTKSTMSRCATLSKSASKSRKLLMPPNDDSSLVYRRKSAGQSCYCSKLMVGTMVGGFQQEKIDASELIHTCDGLESHSDGSVLLRIPAPHVIAARAYRLPTAKMQSETSTKKPNHTMATDSTAASNNSSPGSTTSTTLTRLVQLLHQTSTNKTTQSDNIVSVPIGSTGDEHAPRRLSWERRKYGTAMQRSASIDSVSCEGFWSNIPRPSLDIPRPIVTPFNKRPSTSSLFSNCSTSSQNAQLNINYNEVGSSSSAGSSRRESLLSPSSTRRNKLTRVINEKVHNMMNRCYSNDHTPPHKVHLRNCLRSPGVLLRQKSFHSIADLSRFCHVNNASIATRYSVTDNVISNNHTFATLRSDTDSFDRKKDDTYAHSSLSVHRHVPSSPENQHKSEQSHKARDFCTQQLTNILPLAKQRSQILLKPEEDLKEMEYLIPQAAVSALVPTSTNLALHKQLSQSSLSISRQSLVTRSSDMSHPKNVKLNTETNDVCTDGSTNPIAVSRQPLSASGRVKGGNTPHRNKMSKKQLKLAQAQLDKFTQINVHLHGLFSAVEHGHLDKARTILESTDVDVNCINSDGLSTLDVAVLSNNRSMTKMLLQHGAVEGSKYSTDSIGTKLNALLKDAESRIHDLSGSSTQSTGQSTFATRPSISSIIIGNTSSSVTGCTGNETDKQIGIWERRVKGLRRVLLGWDQARPPDTPSAISVDVTGENSIVVQLLEPVDGAIATKFKVQWSTRSDFGNMVGERIILEWISFHRTMGSKCHINGLTQGRRYFIRAMCGNVKGWGPFKTSVPASVVPSSWRDVENHEDRFIGRQHLLDNLFTAVRLARPADVSELVLDSSSVHRRIPKKKTTIKQLFSVASRFQKNLRRGIYLASIVYCDDKILVTSEDFLPAIEIDESYPSSLHTDYHWLMKVACSWEDVKSLRSDMERNITSAVHFRTKLLSAVYHMQSALGLTDLGSLYYKPFRDSHGTVVLTCVQAVRSQKTISILNSRWLPINKLQKKIVAIHEDSNISEKLILSIGEQIHYHQVSLQRLESGLYLGYLKMQCSVEQIQVVVPVKTPNVLPHYKVRDNSHINAEEWQVLKRHRNSATGCSAASQPLLLDFNANTADVMTEGQRLFLHDLAKAAHKLLVYMNIRLEDASTHRLYDVEVIEHSKDISFLVICPSVELACAAPGQPEILLQNDELVSLSVQAFEMIHLRTYQTGIIQKYSRLSCILELDTALANHSHREAFSTSELEAAKERLTKLQELTTNLNTVWKSVRWLMDVIAFARDKNVQPSVAMHEILEFAQSSGEMHTDSCEQSNLLQLPLRDVKFNKSGSGRGSWPGPAGSVHCDSIAVEHSKSEQNLGRSEKERKVHSVVEMSDQTSSVVDSEQMLHVMQEYKQFDTPLRKSSAESITSEYTAHSSYSATDSEAVHAIPPSQSADMITLETSGNRRRSHQYSGVHRTRTNSNISASNVQPLPDISISHSVPHLSSKPKTMVSSLSLKTPLTTDFDHTSGALNIQEGTENSSKMNVKAASSANLRDGGLYLRSTLSALQTEMKSSTDETQVLKNSSSRSLSHQSSEEDSASGSSVNSEQSSGIIQVYTAYNTGLASGTSLKLHVTPKTSAREVINLVVKQLNMAAVLKGNNGPIYTSEMLDNFCLVAVIGARERCLRDDFKPLQLQNPWKKGRLYVRQKHELLAAIEHSNRKSQLI